MKLLENVRNKYFWSNDTMHGGKVDSYLKLLKTFSSEDADNDKVEKYQKKELIKLLNHAITTVPYYKEQKSTDLSRWPIVTKQIIKNNYNSFVSSDFIDQKLIHMSTSGSTGVPFEILQDIEKKKSVNAETLFYNGKVGYRIGRRIIYLRSIVSETKKTKVQQLAQNILLVDCTDLSDKGIKEKLKVIEKYSKHGGAMLMGYSSTLDAFRKYFEAHGYEDASRCNIYGVVGGSTMLFDETRESIENAFSCKCVSRYANEENGFLGQDGKKNNIFFMNNANYFIEIIRFNSNEHTDPNEVGRIVVTDLRNYAMPMIKYDTGDVGAWVEYGNNRKAIGNFGGRCIDLINNDCNEVVSPHSISTAMWKFKSLDQYQFAQIGVGAYEIRVCTSKQIDEKSLIDSLKKVVGDKSTINVVYLKTIPTLPSGKRKYIVNECVQ